MRKERVPVSGLMVPSGKDLPAYCKHLPMQSLQQVWPRIVKRVVTQKRFLQANYTVAELAKDIDTNTRYISAALLMFFGKGYTHFVNHYRVNYACAMLADNTFDHLTIEEIGLMAGFVKRQTFYKAFAEELHTSPNAFRRNHKGKTGV